MSATPETVLQELGQHTKNASRLLAQASIEQVHSALEELSQLLHANVPSILEANAKDVDGGKLKDLSPALIDRLTLNEERINAIADSVLEIIKLDDPVGQILEATTRPNGLIIEKTSVPIGVLGMIYESRPNVTIDAAALCLKSRNAVILRGGSESFHSSTLLHQLVQKALEKHNLPAAAVSMIPDTDRAYVSAMLNASNIIDVMIPRGGKGLTGLVMDKAKMPVFAHLDGNCHIYVHHDVDADLAVSVIRNAKLRRTGICGAAESLLFDADLDEQIRKNIINTLLDEGCTVVGDASVQALNDNVTPANEDDWGTEYLDKKISIKTVANVNEAINHINQYGSHHTDCILTNDNEAAKQFLDQIDSAIVMHNTSTQFADGGEFGMGAEIGIGTGKLHARGPVGLKQLTTFKYIVKGNGQVRP